MAKASTITRRVWQCPSCGRTFRIPQAAPPPLNCPKCATDAESQNAKSSVSSPTKKSKSNKPVVETTFFESEPEYERATRNESPAATQSATSTAILDSGSIETAEILEHLRNISHTMTLVRRVMWLSMGMMILFAVFSLGSAFTMMQKLSGILPVVQKVQPAGNPVNPNQQLPALNDLKGLDIEGVNLENMDDLNKVIDALNERNKLADSLLE